MPIALYRVDERLIHGQVTVGWGSVLNAEHYLVVDDDLAAGEWEAELYRLGAPDGTRVSFRTIESARGELDALRRSAEVTVVLTRSVPVMSQLAGGEAMEGERVNLGGLHDGPGRTRVLDYLHLAPADRRAIRALVTQGVRVSARDLPGATPIGVSRLLDDRT